MNENQEKRESCLYFDISKQERDSAIRYLLGIIIKCRTESNFPSNYYTFDEDVNVYLAHLLFAISLPEYHDMAEPYLSLDSSDILNWVRSTEDRILRYFIFKVNADHILIHTAVFNDLLEGRANTLMKKSPKHFRELAKLYYDQAAAYHKRIYRNKTGVVEVLQKIANYFDAYQNLLKQVRREYFDFVNSFRDQAFRQFMGEVKDYELKIGHHRQMDLFLDLYAQWLGGRDPGLRDRIVRLAGEIKQKDPGFRFDAGRQLYGEEGWSDDRKCA
ncbi:MAG: hypothetical protein WC352_00905 [Candidatus Omnitrophota bacterium]|jgi:hypothetical protein